MPTDETSNDPLISVVTPCLNPGDRLKRCLDSVAAQTYRSVEHIVVDGASTDGTVDVLRDTPDIRWVSEPDDGQAHAINKGFRMAKGSILGWLNADDVLMPETLSRVAAAFSRVHGAGWVYGGCRLNGPGWSRVWQPPARLSRRYLEAGLTIPQPGSFVARWAIQRIGDVDESFSLTMDFELWLRLMGERIEGVCLPDVLAHVEIHPASKSGSIPTDQWLGETVRAFLKHGAVRPAAVALGRSIAHEASENGVVERRRLLHKVERTVPKALGNRSIDRRTRKAMRAGAFVEASRIEYPRGIPRFRHLLAASPWLCRETRLQILEGVRDKVWRR